MKIRELRAEITSMLSPSAEASTDASVLIMKVLNIGKTQLILGDDEVPDSVHKEILGYAVRVVNGEPVQYVVGECEFMSLRFKVKSGVLIPRADTEILVETVISRLKNQKRPLIYDLCCGSGCIGISLAKYIDDASVFLADISPVALEVSKQNAELCGVSDRVTVISMDVTKDVISAAADCIVSNPPYIKTAVLATLDKKVRGFEPRLALDGGGDGLDFYRRIIKTAVVKDGGLLAFEIGYDQGAEVSALMKNSGYGNVEIISDIEKRDRVVLGYKML